MGLLAHFYIPLTPNQKFSDKTDAKGNRHVVFLKHMEESWVELFIDLIYVALFLTLGSAIENCGVGGYVVHFFRKSLIYL
jgi:hypothetical protein